MQTMLSQPLANFLGLRESDSSLYLLEVDYDKNLSNHYDSFHASAIFSFAEYSAGAFLVRYFPDYRHNTLPIVRRANIKYSHKPALKTLFSEGELVKTSVERVSTELEAQGRSIFEIQINVKDADGKLVFLGNFEWFVTMKP